LEEFQVNQPQNAHQYLTVKQFISQNPVSDSTVRRWIKSGVIPSIQPGGANSAILIPADALMHVDDGSHAIDAESAKIPPPSLAGPAPRWSQKRKS
jgi:excisionase family DNA binding protein